MNAGLPLELFNLVKAKGYITYDEMEAKTKELGYKVDTGTRKMRLLTEKSEKHTPLIEDVKNDKGHIIGYRYIGTSTGIESPKATQTPLTAKPVALFDTPSPKYKSQYE